ncbi:predicted protein [Sclerotinia sclerotiorum 1980 UF-70]|nr:predicted protein [Sclerotinia sclerotiorum 1980 UF-70]EDN92570.1 predicted protein [Sclerotinia sclerotiorum 1980 UF-70]
MVRVERGVAGSLDGLEGWGDEGEGEDPDAVFPTTRLGDVTTSRGVRNEGDNLKLKNFDEERGVPQVSVIRQGSEATEGSN